MNTNATEYQTLVTACQEARAKVRQARTLAESECAAIAWERAESARVAWLRQRASLTPRDVRSLALATRARVLVSEENAGE